MVVDVDCLGDLNLVVKDRLHQLPVVLITGHWPVANVCDFAQPRPMRMPSTPVLASSSTPPGSSVTYSPGMPMRPPARVTVHQRVQHRRGPLDARVVPVAARFEADAIDGVIHFGHADDLRDLVAERGFLPQIDRLAAEAARLREPLRDHVADDDDRRSQQMARCRAARPTGPAPATYTMDPVVTPAVTAP